MAHAPATFRLRAAVVGPAADGEFADARGGLARIATTCVAFDDLSALLAADEPVAGPWDLIVLLQTRSGQFSSRALEAVCRRWPTARVMLVAGVWSAGELRSGTPLAGVVRVPWHAAAAFFLRAARDMSRQRCPDWGWPLAAGIESRVLRTGTPLLTGVPSPATGRPAPGARKDTVSSARKDATATRDARPIVLIDAYQPDVAAWLADACRHLGLAPVHGDVHHLPHVPDAGLLLWLAHQDGHDAEHLERLRRPSPQTPLVVLSSFLRPADVALFRTAGAVATLSLPLVLDDLAEAIACAWRRGDPQPATAPHAA